MAQTTTSKTAADGTTAQASPTVSTNADLVVIERPIVYEKTRNKKRGKRKYSKNLKDPQKLEVDATRSANRVARAVADGISEYRGERNKSARRKRDGAIKDVVRNIGRGLSEALDTGSRAPSDLTRRATTKRLSRLLIVPPPFSYFMRG